MMSAQLFIFLFLLTAVPEDLMPSILTITGAQSEEELEESVIERFSALSNHPLDLNAASRSRLLASGLFSSYQVVSFLEWRNRSGDVLSYEELALVDGFNQEFADALRPFTCLESKAPPGQRRRLDFSNSLMSRASMRLSGENSVAAFGLKYHAELGSRLQLDYANRTTYSSQTPGWGSGSLVYYGKRYLGKAVLGAFNAHFGQGLLCWSGFSLSGLSSVQAFSRNGTGISSTSSFSPSMCGAACDFNWGRWTASAAYSWEQKLPLANVSWTGRRVTAGLTSTLEAASADIRIGLPGLSIFSEFACSYKADPAAIAGLLWAPAYGRKFALLSRWYSTGYDVSTAGAARSGTKTSDEIGLAAAASLKIFGASLDWAMHPSSGVQQLKFIGTVAEDFQLGPVRLRPELRFSSRYRTDISWRNDLRAELSACLGDWQMKGRWNGLWCKDFAWMWYAELLRSGPLGKGNLLFSTRFTLFKVDYWDDRIYSYERDVPGCFTVPACYGRGWSLYGIVGWKLPEWGRKAGHALYVRASVLQYPWTYPAKEGKTELRLQYAISL